MPAATASSTAAFTRPLSSVNVLCASRRSDSMARASFCAESSSLRVMPKLVALTC